MPTIIIVTAAIIASAALSRNDRIYRGRDGRYYCRRNDGTTGLIIGAGVGALIGNSIDDGRSSLLGTLIGAGAGGGDRPRDRPQRRSPRPALPLSRLRLCEEGASRQRGALFLQPARRS